MPAEIKNTFDKLGIPEAEKKFLAGVKAQFESEVVYGSLQEDLGEAGRDLHRHRHGRPRASRPGARVLRARSFRRTDNKFAALNSAVWSGGSFIYVPPGREDRVPLQAYFRINAANMGQFERTLIIVDEGAEVHYVEGCTAPMYSTESLHSAVVEIIAKRGRPLPLHDDPELGQQHLQPGDQAGDGLRRRLDGMGRRQPRQPADDEVPGRLHDGAGRPRRDPLGRLRLGRPAPGRRRQAGPLRSAHHRAGSSPSRSPRTAAAPATAAWCKVEKGAKNVEVERRLRRPDPRRRRAAATPIRTSKSKSRT